MNGYEGIDCQSFLQRLEADHRRVNLMLRQLNELCRSASELPAAPAGDRRELVQQLEQLRSELAKHFSEEENGGCMEEAACRCPSLTSEVSRLEAQHATLLQSLDQLVDSVRSGKCVISTEQFATFERELREHESQEEKLVRHGFNVA